MLRIVALCIGAYFTNLTRASATTPLGIPEGSVWHMNTSAYPICTTNVDLCRTGARANGALNTYAARATYARNNNYNAITNIDQHIIHHTPIRVDMHHMPTWWYPWSVHGAAYRSLLHTCAVPCHVMQHPPPNWNSHVSLGYLGTGHATSTNTHQAAAMFSMESCGGTQCQFNPGVLDKTDLLMSSQIQADVFAGYGGWTGSRLHLDPPTLDKFSPGIAYSPLFVTNCGAHARTTWLKELMSRIKIDSYGSCPRHTANKPCSRHDERTKKCSKIEVSSHYPFHFAFENQPMLPGYATEKFIHAYGSNSLPVLWSASDIVKYTPGPHSFINVADFSSPKELADYLIRVRGDPDLYNSYFAWRRNTTAVKHWTSTWIKHSFNAWGPPGMCRLCEAYVEKFGCHLSPQARSHPACPKMARFT